MSNILEYFTIKIFEQWRQNITVLYQGRRNALSAPLGLFCFLKIFKFISQNGIRKSNADVSSVTENPKKRFWIKLN